MEKPEWFETVDALQGAPDSALPSNAHARTSIAKRLASVGVAVVIMGGGVAVAQSHIGIPTNEALSSVSAASSSAAAIKSPAVAPIPAASPSAPIGRATISGGRPSITGAAAGGDGDND